MQEGIDLRDPISELFVTFYFGVTSQLHKELNHITRRMKEVKISFFLLNNAIQLEIQDFILFLRKSFVMGQTLKVDNGSKDFVYFLALQNTQVLYVLV